jgi:hypothetical protein
MHHGLPLDARQSGFEAAKEFQPHAGLLILVVGEDFGQVALGLGADAHERAHQSASRRCFTTSHESPSAGFS